MKKLNKKIVRIMFSVMLTISLIMGLIPIDQFSETVYAATKYEITVTANSYAGTYDGTEKSASGFVTLEFTVDGNKYTVSGLTTSDPKSTNVCNLTNKISGTPVVKDSSLNDVTDQFDVKLEDGWLEIHPRYVTLTSASDEKTYDGNSLTNDYVTVGGNGFAPGEGATYDVTGSQTIVGNSDNSFSYTLNDNTKAHNYIIDKFPGTLKVVSRTDKYKISPQANSKTVNYDGFSWEVTGFETDTYEVDGNTYTVSGLEAYANEKEVGEHPVNVTGTAVVKDSKGNDVTSEFEVTPKPGKLIIKNSMIQYTVTFKIENGEWNDGGSDDKTVTLSRKENEDLLLTLKAEDIPGVGNKPSSGFKAGEWDITPSTEMVISRDRVFTYTYDQKAPVSHTVTFKVENGTWNDGTTEDKKIIVSGYEGDTLKLSADQIPLVGTKPDSEHKKGKWDVTPNIATEITGDTTYTYTYADKKMIKYTVTFKVENGEWDDGGSEDKVVTLSREEAEDLLLLLKNEDIPAVGNKPSNGFKAGGWDTAPRTDLVISEDKTYTYTYAQKASISQNVTFKVENGTWNDGTTDDIKVILTGYEGDTLKLAEGDIPEVGDKPEDTYKTGGWDIVPVADTEITTDTTYTYSYAKKDTVTHKATFKVVNGTWSDGTSEDKIVTLSGYEGDILKLSADQIPAAGDKPGDGFTAGKWDVVPDTDTKIAEDKINIYTYADKEEVVKPDYYFVKGADSTVTEGAETEQVIVVKRSVDDEHCKDHHKDVEFGGVILEKDRDYLVGHGSTIVTIKGSVIKKLKPGKYTINVIFDDGVATTTLTVKGKTTESTTESNIESTTETTTQATTEEVKKPAEKKKDTNAATGDDMNLWFALMLLSMSGMAVVFTVGKKKRNK